MTDKGYKNVFVIAPNYPGGKDVVNGFKRYYKGNYAGEAYTKLGQLDYAVEISQMRAAKPDAVFFFLPGGMGVNFLKQWQQAGMNKDFPLFGTGWSFDQDTLAAVGEPTLGALNTSHWNLDLDNAANKKFVADFEKKYGRLPNEFAAQGYDAALLLDAAVRDVKGKIGPAQGLGSRQLQVGAWRIQVQQEPFPDPELLLAAGSQGRQGPFREQDGGHGLHRSPGRLRLGLQHVTDPSTSFGAPCLPAGRAGGRPPTR